MRRLPAAGAAALLLLSTGFFAARCAFDPALPFVVQDEAAPWILYPAAPDGLMGLAERDALPVTRFRRRFAAPAGGAPQALLRVRAMREFRLWLNGEPLPVEDAGHWRRFRRVPLSGRLRPGPNELRVDVTNPTGPALLSLQLSGLPQPLRSGEDFAVSRGAGPQRRAIRLSTERVNPSSYAMPTPFEGLAARGSLLALLAALALGAAFALRSPALAATRPRLERALPYAVVLGWSALFLGSFLEIPLRVGFDAHHHLAYVDFLRERGALPVASDGWMMFHPPLYYAAVAALVTGQEAIAPGSASLFAWRLVGFGAGLASALLCGALATRVCGRRSPEVVFATLFGALLPMNLYVSAYLTNESLAAALSGAVVVSAAGLLRAPTPSRRQLAVFALLVSAAVLTKYTAWIVASVAGFFLLARWALVERAAPAALARRLALVGGLVLGLAGWFYLRSALHFGTPFPLNVDLPGETRVWWSPPGFATPAFFWRFGEALVHPFLAGTHTAWNSLYATFWGDGQLAGQVFAAARHPYWDWQLMAFGYALALPATALLAVGAWRSLRLAWHAPDPSERAVHAMLLTLVYALVFSVLYMTLRQPDYGQAKAFYALAATTPLAAFFALGARAVPPRLRLLRDAYLALLLLVSFFTYWGRT